MRHFRICRREAADSSLSVTAMASFSSLGCWEASIDPYNWRCGDYPAIKKAGTSYKCELWVLARPREELFTLGLEASTRPRGGRVPARRAPEGSRGNSTWFPLSTSPCPARTPVSACRRETRRVDSRAPSGRRRWLFCTDARSRGHTVTSADRRQTKRLYRDQAERRVVPGRCTSARATRLQLARNGQNGMTRMIWPGKLRGVESIASLRCHQREDARHASKNCA